MDDEGGQRTQKFKIAFFENDAATIDPHNDHPMVITISSNEWDIKIFLVDQESSSNILN